MFNVLWFPLILIVSLLVMNFVFIKTTSPHVAWKYFMLAVNGAALLCTAALTYLWGILFLLGMAFSNGGETTLGIVIALVVLLVLGSIFYSSYKVYKKETLKVEPIESIEDEEVKVVRSKIHEGKVFVLSTLVIIYVALLGSSIFLTEGRWFLLELEFTREKLVVTVVALYVVMFLATIVSSSFKVGFVKASSYLVGLLCVFVLGSVVYFAVNTPYSQLTDVEKTQFEKRALTEVKWQNDGQDQTAVKTTYSKGEKNTILVDMTYVSNACEIDCTEYNIVLEYRIQNSGSYAPIHHVNTQRPEFVDSSYYN